MATKDSSRPLSDWDAQAYDNLPLPHERWGALTVARLRLVGTERVVDFGCGTGRDTMRLLAMLPHGRVIAVDGSQRMLAALRARLGAGIDRVQVLQTDLNRPLPLDAPVDAVFSVATLHWLPDHPSVFRHIAEVLHPGGQFVAECGGRGNIASVSTAVADVLGSATPTNVWNFAGPDETCRNLQEAGFTEIAVDLVSDLVTVEDDQQMERFLQTVVLGGHLRSIAKRHRARFASSVAARLRRRELDYVRLRIAARNGRCSST